MKHTWTYDVEHVYVVLHYETVDVCVNKHETWTRPPVAQEPGFDVLMSYLALYEDVVFEEDHRCCTGGTDVRVMRKTGKERNTPAAI